LPDGTFLVSIAGMTHSILIVDDDARIRASLSEALSADGWSVSIADSGEAALGEVAKSRPEVVLADIRMPGMDGIELLRRLRAGSRDVDVLLMTAYSDLPTVAEAMRDGAADFLVKPLGLRALRRVLERVSEDRTARARARTASRKEAKGKTGPDTGRPREPAGAPRARPSGPPGAFRPILVVVGGESGT